MPYISGGVFIDMKWESSKLVNVRFFSKYEGKVRLEYQGNEIAIEIEGNKEYFPLIKEKHIWE